MYAMQCFVLSDINDQHVNQSINSPVERKQLQIKHFYFFLNMVYWLLTTLFNKQPTGIQTSPSLNGTLYISLYRPAGVHARQSVVRCYYHLKAQGKHIRHVL